MGARGRPLRRQRGVTLIVSLLLLAAVLLLAATSAGVALMGEKAARAERDRQVALQAAEDALMDAEHDIENAVAERAEALAAPGFPAGCGTGAVLGLCARAAPADLPPWQTVDLAADDTSNGPAVPLGRFTGAAMETGAGVLPWRRPRYVIERLPYHRPGDEVGAAPRFFYRVTALGFGSRQETQVVLQTAYRRPDEGAADGAAEDEAPAEAGAEAAAGSPVDSASR